MAEEDDGVALVLRLQFEDQVSHSHADSIDTFAVKVRVKGVLEIHRPNHVVRTDYFPVEITKPSLPQQRLNLHRRTSIRWDFLGFVFKLDRPTQRLRRFLCRL